MEEGWGEEGKTEAPPVGLSAILFYHYFNKSEKDTLDIVNAYWLIGYLIGMGIFSYFGNYGGNHLIPPYWDLVYLIGFCGLIFCWAVISRKPSALKMEFSTRCSA